MRDLRAINGKEAETVEAEIDTFNLKSVYVARCVVARRRTHPFAQ